VGWWLRCLAWRRKVLTHLRLYLRVQHFLIEGVKRLVKCKGFSGLLRPGLVIFVEG